MAHGLYLPRGAPASARLPAVVSHAAAVPGADVDDQVRRLHMLEVADMICLVAFFAIASASIVVLVLISGVFWWLEKNGHIGQGPGVE